MTDDELLTLAWLGGLGMAVTAAGLITITVLYSSWSILTMVYAYLLLCWNTGGLLTRMNERRLTWLIPT